MEPFTMAELLELIKAYGPWIGLCLFFIWQSWLRENKLADKLDNADKYQRDTLAGLVRENTQAMTGLREVLKLRPCLAEDEEAIEGRKAVK